MISTPDSRLTAEKGHSWQGMQFAILFQIAMAKSSSIPACNGANRRGEEKKHAVNI